MNTLTPFTQIGEKWHVLQVVRVGIRRPTAEHIIFLFRTCYTMAEPHLVEKKATFSSFSHLLDARILRSLADMGFARPTLVQAKAIPLALENRDILARARTGSGKTAAYCVPIVQKIISAKSVGTNVSNVQRKYIDCSIESPFFFFGWACEDFGP